ncbi:MAG: hypothetical protein KF764_35270 [Labilithrix sp.]|nr:hypothetical protein [Labilithrix sp.]MBX3220502.1 hypothetical protein [Labilithrix sp.]
MLGRMDLAAIGLVGAVVGCAEPSTSSAIVAPAPVVVAPAPVVVAPASDAGSAPAASTAASAASTAETAPPAPPPALSVRDEAVVRAAHPRLLACYKSGVAADKELGGVVSFALDVGSGGKVLAVLPAPSTFPASVIACMTKRLEALRFERPKDGPSESLPVAIRCIPPSPYDGPARVEDGSKPHDPGF